MTTSRSTIAAGPAEAERGRGPRAVPPPTIRRPQALLARGRRELDPDPRRRARPGRRRRARRGRHGHGAPGPPERPGEHHRQELRADLPGIRGRARSALGRGLGRRDLPPRRIREAHVVRRERSPRHPGLQPQPPGVRGPGRGGHGQSQAGPRGTARGLPRAVGADPRRGRLRRTGRGGGDAEPLPAPRLSHRGRGPRRHQQPARLHDAARAWSLERVCHRRREDGAGADPARERGRARGVPASGPPRLRVPPGVRQGRDHRHVVLPAMGSQRGRRAVLHAAPDVPTDRRAALGAQALHGGPGEPRRSLGGGRRRGAAGVLRPARPGVRGDRGTAPGGASARAAEA